MSSVVKILVCVALLALGTARAKDLNILVLADDAQVSCTAPGAMPTARVNIMQVRANGQAAAVLGQRSVACSAENAWSQLGRQLVRSQKVDKVRFFAISKPGLTADDLLEGGSMRASLNALFDEAKQEHVQFDYALLQQDGQGGGNTYLYKVTKLMRTSSANAKIDKWIVARGSSCNTVPSPSIIEAQARAGNNPLFSRFPGPNLQTLGVQDRMSGCQFSIAGQEKLAGMWVDAIKQADKSDALYQKETLLYYFK